MDSQRCNVAAFLGSCSGACTLGVSLSLGCVRDCLWWGVCVCARVALGLFLLCLSGSPALLSAFPWQVPSRMGVGTPPEGGFLGWKPLSPEAWMRVLPATLAHLSPAC